VFVYRFFFFFSSRRRHTRSYGDWSSDVCSSDLTPYGNHSVQNILDGMIAVGRIEKGRLLRLFDHVGFEALEITRAGPQEKPGGRSEERRVGKECRSRWWQYE